MAREEGDNDLCRCCHNEGSFKSLYETYPWMDEDVIYLNMLQDCLDVEMLPVSENLQHMLSAICEECIEKLHNAMKFKRQVQKCERRFKEVYGSFVQQEDAEVKIEDDGDTKVNVAEIAITNVQSLPKSELTIDDDVDMDIDDDFRDGCQTDSEPWRFQPSTSNMAKQFDKLMNDDLNNDDLTVLMKDNLLKETAKKITPKKTTETTPKKQTKTTAKKGTKKVKEKTANSEKKKETNPEDQKATVDNERIHIKIQRGVHFEEKNEKLQCILCNAQYPIRNRDRTLLKSITRHVKSHHIPTYKCSICAEVFFNKVPLLTHKLEKHNIDRKFKCNACDASFHKKRQLAEHMNGFHKLGELHTCKECGFETYSLSGIRKHKLVHLKDRNYKCKYCPKAFKRSSTLLFHERSHTGDKRKKCLECGAAFVQRASLKYHMLKHHPGVK